MSQFKELKQKVFEANMELVEKNLVILTWGNASQIDRAAKVIAIKPSGVDYKTLTPEDIVITDFEGNIVEGSMSPSSDLPTHIELYRAFPLVGGIVHTHSTYATCFAQSGFQIPCYGTTHADYFHGDIPCTRELTKDEIELEYEKHTGLVIAEYFHNNNLDFQSMPAVLIKNHGPFTWGQSAQKAVENSYVLEQVALMALQTQLINGNVQPAAISLQDKHYFRKHGVNAYYGQIKHK